MYIVLGANVGLKTYSILYRTKNPSSDPRARRRTITRIGRIRSKCEHFVEGEHRRLITAGAALVKGGGGREGGRHPGRDPLVPKIPPHIPGERRRAGYHVFCG